MPDKGLLLIFSGPSGVGKGTVMSSLLSQREDIRMSVSVTTRDPRPGDQEGVQYFFRSREEVEQMIREDQLLEYAEYSGNYYGTPLQFVENERARGHHVVLEIEVQGALKVMERCPDAVTVFLAPPSWKELEHRLRGRGTETEEVICRRLETARRELEQMDRYQYVVVNRDVATAVRDIEDILHTESMRFCRMKHIKEEILSC